MFTLGRQNTLPELNAINTEHYRYGRLESPSVAQHLNGTGHKINIADLKLIEGVHSPKKLEEDKKQ